MRGQDAMRDHRNHRGAARHHPDPCFARDVVRSKYEAGQPGVRIARRGAQFVGIEHRAGGLDHGPDLDRRIGAHLSEARRDGVEIIDSRNLGHQNAVGFRGARHRHIVAPPWRVQAVGPDPDLALAKALGRDYLRDLLARLGLGVGRHRIFEIQDQAIGGEGPRLFQRPRVRSRHEQQAAARADHGRVPFKVGTPRE